MTSDEIDDLARALPAYRPAAAQVEQARTAILAGAPGITRMRPASRRVTYALIAVALAATAAAAATVSSLMDRPAGATVEPTEPTPQARAAVVDAAVAPDPAPPVDPIEPVVPEPQREKPRKVQKAPAPHAPAAKAATTAPGEAEFRAGWAALKAGEPERAAESFAASRQAKGSVLAEDASFWEGIALARAGKASKAITALRRFVGKYPSASRAGEAAAKLGWLLYESGDLDAAETYFRSAVDDVVPKVQKSARDGLLAIERTRGEP